MLLEVKIFDRAYFRLKKNSEINPQPKLELIGKALPKKDNL